jgi:hypothetical protein
VGVGIFPPLKVFLPGSAFLFFFDRPFPWLVSLFGGFPIGPLARIIVWFLFAHSAPREGQPGNEAAVPEPKPNGKP